MSGRPRRIWTATLLISFFSACTALESNRAGVPFLNANGQPKATQFAGTYSLPRRQLSFEILGTSNFMHQSKAFGVKKNSERRCACT